MIKDKEKLIVIVACGIVVLFLALMNAKITRLEVHQQYQDMHKASIYNGNMITNIIQVQGRISQAHEGRIRTLETNQLLLIRSSLEELEGE